MSHVSLDFRSRISQSYPPLHIPPSSETRPNRPAPYVVPITVYLNQRSSSTRDRRLLSPPLHSPTHQAHPPPEPALVGRLEGQAYAIHIVGVLVIWRFLVSRISLDFRSRISQSYPPSHIPPRSEIRQIALHPTSCQSQSTTTDGQVRRATAVSCPRRSVHLPIGPIPLWNQRSSVVSNLYRTGTCPAIVARMMIRTTTAESLLANFFQNI